MRESRNAYGQIDRDIFENDVLKDQEVTGSGSIRRISHSVGCNLVSDSYRSMTKEAALSFTDGPTWFHGNVTWYEEPKHFILFLGLSNSRKRK